MQDASIDEMRALAVAIQHMIRDAANVAFVFAGLPSMVEGVVNGKTLTFLRRALPVELGLVECDEVAESLGQTICESGMRIGEQALGRLADATRGYPFMIQLAGYHAWQIAHREQGEGGEICLAHVQAGTQKARVQFDRMVVEPALQRLPNTLLLYVLAMAEDRGAPSHVGTIAQRLDKDVRALSSYRSRLIEANVIEATSRGVVEFAIPYMADYLLVHRDELVDELGE